MANFEEHLTQLETVVERLERGDLTLEESVRLFEEGMKLSQACKEELEQAEGAFRYWWRVRVERCRWQSWRWRETRKRLRWKMMRTRTSRRKWDVVDWVSNA